MESECKAKQVPHEVGGTRCPSDMYVTRDALELWRGQTEAEN